MPVPALSPLRPALHPTNPRQIAREMTMLLTAGADARSQEIACSVAAQLALVRAAEEVRSLAEVDMLGQSAYCDGIRAGVLAAARLLEYLAAPPEAVAPSSVEAD